MACSHALEVNIVAAGTQERSSRRYVGNWLE